MIFRKSLNKVPAAACWDYVGIPLKGGRVQACLSEDVSKRICTGCPWQTVGITQKSPSLQGSPWQTVGHSRWASEARSVPSNPTRKLVQLAKEITNKQNYKQFNTKNKSYEKNFCNPYGVGNVFFRKRCSNGSRRS